MTDLMEFFEDTDTDSIPIATGQRDPIPADRYVLTLTNQEVKPTKAGNGAGLNCMFRVQEGPHEGAIIFSNFNVKNPSKQAQDIGIGQFKALCVACEMDFDEVKHDVSLLVGIPFIGKVGFAKKTEGYAEKNEIKAYEVYTPGGTSAKPPAEKAAAKPATTAKPVTAVKVTPKGGMPWAKKAAVTEKTETDEPPL